MTLGVARLGKVTSLWFRGENRVDDGEVERARVMG